MSRRSRAAVPRKRWATVFCRKKNRDTNGDGPASSQTLLLKNKDSLRPFPVHANYFSSVASREARERDFSVARTRARRVCVRTIPRLKPVVGNSPPGGGTE